MQDKDIKILEYVGQPADLIELTEAMDDGRLAPRRAPAEHQLLRRQLRRAGPATSPATSTSSRRSTRFEMAADNKATQDYLDLMEQYNPDGKVAGLGVQGMSSWLLFAQAATACGSDLTASASSRTPRRRRTGPGAGSTPRRPRAEHAEPVLPVLDATDGFFYNEEATAPTDGVFNCDPENVVDVSGLSARRTPRG